MKYSKFFGRTKHETPHDANCKNAELLTKAGFVDKVAAGIYNYLPLGIKSLHKIHNIIREEMNAVGAQEILMPAMHPVELWETTGRIKKMEEILFKTKSGEKDFVLGATHEETVTPLAKKSIQSYKDLPLCVYQFQTKFRNEPRAKSGILRGREFGMKDMYSFHTTEEDLNEYYTKVMEAYLNVYARCSLEAFVIEAGGGDFTDQITHEFSVKTEAGEDTIISCPECKFAQNLEIAQGKYDNPSSDEPEKERELLEIERPKTIKETAKQLGIDEWRILKSVVYNIEGEGLIAVLIRGDFNISEDKVKAYFDKPVRAASSKELEEHGLVEGFISPVMADGKANNKIPFIGDFSIKEMKNFETGANEINKDWKNLNIGRDFEVKDFADFVEVKGGFMCPKCDAQLEEDTGVEVGNIFKLGTIYSDVFDLSFTDKDQKKKPVIMGCYGIGATRLLGTIVEAFHDDKGIIWPKSVAPYMVHLVTIGDDDQVQTIAQKLYENMNNEGIEVLYDDRDAGPGLKLNDADLIGLPLRIVISKRTIGENSVEWKERNQEEAKNVKIDDVIKNIKKFANN